MKKAVITIATVTIIGIGSTFFTSTASTVGAESLNELQDKQSQIESERSEIKDNLSKAESEIADVLIELEELNEEIAQVEEALQKNEDKLDETNTEISEKEKEIAELEEAIEKRSNILKDRMVSYQKNGGNIGFLDVIFGSKSFGDLVSRVSAITKITDSDTELINQQEEDKKSVGNKLDELTEMQVELEGMQETILAQKEQTVEQKDELKQKEQELIDKKKELQVEDSRLASIEREVRQSIAAKRTPSTASASSSSSNSSSDGNLNTLSKKENKSSTPAKASGSLSTVINAGYQYLGVPYVWGGKTPSGFDCSGFVSWAFAQGGYSVPSSTAALQSTGTKVSYSNIKPGDLVFFNTYKTNGHVGIYIGNGQFIGSQSSYGLSVKSMTSGYWKDHFAGHVRRVVN
ncbi:Cell wall-associated hydrolase, NlpC family [Oceanobacillus limi]|uniref:Cell wall-associated hydrolase, NlpC family n=1 Tax=Oceanobacillus limi TaxID=930131 RepID=A0A1I0DUH3_9BACI|nr:C40 family peptidase [Oceanobacillus limi]SET35458.1 Cell wall-associated hydrolase, NlpC family [Oceanobacillus limi]